MLSELRSISQSCRERGGREQPISYWEGKHHRLVGRPYYPPSEQQGEKEKDEVSEPTSLVGRKGGEGV